MPYFFHFQEVYLIFMLLFFVLLVVYSDYFSILRVLGTRQRFFCQYDETH